MRTPLLMQGMSPLEGGPPTSPVERQSDVFRASAAGDVQALRQALSAGAAANQLDKVRGPFQTRGLLVAVRNVRSRTLV